MVLTLLQLGQAGEVWEPSWKAVLFVKRGGLDRNILSLFLALSVLMKQMKHKTSFNTDGARTGLARLEGRK
jgi:hypothetical protein